MTGTTPTSFSDRALRVCIGFGAALALLAPAQDARASDHDIGWVCVQTEDVRIAQIASFNIDGESLGVIVPGERLHIEQDPTGPGGRVCIPAVVSVGGDELPPETIVFERKHMVAGQALDAEAELVLKHTEAAFADTTVKIRGVKANWRRARGVWTFSSPEVVRFRSNSSRALDGEGDGPPPPGVFSEAVAAKRFSEPCRPMELAESAAASIGGYDRETRTVTVRGVEVVRLEKGALVSWCDGLSPDGKLTPVAVRSDDTPGAKSTLGWYLVPKDTPFLQLDAGAAFEPDAPFGGYHICQQPTWLTKLYENVPLAGVWELQQSGAWTQFPSDDDTRLDAGTPVRLIAHRQSFALIAAMFGGVERTLVVAGRAVELPTGPASQTRRFVGGLCQWPVGQWRSLKATTHAYTVSQDAVGSELVGLWLEIPHDTSVLVLCQDKGGQCNPIYVGGSQTVETDRVLLVRYAGHLLGIKESDVQGVSDGTFAAREDRSRFWREEDVLRESIPEWAFDLGPGVRLSFVDKDHFAWDARLRMQRIQPGLGFEGMVGAGVDGLGSFLELAGGVGDVFMSWPEYDLELRWATLGKLDVRFSQGGGFGLDAIAKLQLRWLNDFTPISFEAGLNLGFGGTFGDDGKSGVHFGIPLYFGIQLFAL